MKKEIKIYLLLTGLLAIHLLFIIFIQKSIFPIHLPPQNFFLLDLIGRNMYLTIFFTYVFELGNLILLWLIGKKTLNGYWALVPSAIYAISPWSSYLSVAGSFYIFLLFLVLVFTYSLLLIREDVKLLGSILFLLSSLIAIYSSVLFLILISITLILILILKINNLKDLAIPIILFIFFTLPLFFLIFKSHIAFKNVIQREITIFADPGLVNTANQFQGEAERSGLKTLARVSENKYLFYFESFLLKYTDQLVPVTFFTPQYKLLNFSFTPPIFLGFLIPFLYGLYMLILKSNTRKFLFISTLLVIPSVLAKDIVSLDRLIIFFPIVIFIIVSGIMSMIELRKQKLIKIFLFLSAFLIVFQLIVTLGDIKSREKLRFESYFGQKYEITEQ